MDRETTLSVESRTLSNKSTSTGQRLSQAVFHVTSRHDHQRVPHSFRHQPTSSTRPEIRQRAPRLAKQSTRKTQVFNSAPLPVCRVSALCPVRNFPSHKNQTMGCVTHMMNVHVSHHCRCHVQCADLKQALCKYAMWMVCGSNMVHSLAVLPSLNPFTEAYGLALVLLPKFS